MGALLQTKKRLYTVKEKIKQFNKAHIRKRIALLKKDIYFSIGETCLPDDILSRNGLKSFSSPYASLKSNIEYILAFEKEKYKDFLNPEYLRYEDEGGKKMPVNDKYSSAENKYSARVMKGVSFPHHDVIADQKKRDIFKRRCERLLKLKHKNITMLYYHYLCEGTDTDMLIRHLSELSKIYESRENRVTVYMFRQVIVPDEGSRGYEYRQHQNIHIYTFYTLDHWAGKDTDLLWARCDDDLLKNMIEKMRAG